MMKLLILLATIAVPVVAGNWYVAAYGDIGYNDYASDSPLPTTITSFDECVAAGNPVLESYPEQCRSEAGQIFTNQINSVPSDSPGMSEPKPADAHLDAIRAETIEAVRAQAAKDLSVAPEMIEVTSVIEAEWPDGCLGLAIPDQMCIMMITFGYEFSVTANGETAIYRTDQTGSIVMKDA